MKLLLTEYKTSDNHVNFDLKFKDSLTLIYGESGAGKTMLFKAIERDTLLENTNIICLNYDDISSGNIAHTLASAKNKIIVIDNADVALSLSQRMQISLDKENQYIIFTHSADGYKPGNASLAELVIKNGKGILVYRLL